MTIQISPGPEEGTSVVQSNLILPKTFGAVVGAEDTPRGIRRIDKPYPVFSADLEDVLDDNRLLQSARLTSWQYVIFEDEKVVALAEVADGRPLRYASRQSSSVAEAVLKAIADAEKLDSVQKSDYELRILRIPELYLLAVWLHSATSDLLLPVRPFTKTLGDGSSFTEKQVVAALRPLAQVRAATADA